MPTGLVVGLMMEKEFVGRSVWQNWLVKCEITFSVMYESCPNVNIIFYKKKKKKKNSEIGKKMTDSEAKT